MNENPESFELPDLRAQSREEFSERYEQEKDTARKLNQEIGELRTPEVVGSVAVRSLAAWRDRLSAEFLNDEEKFIQSLYEARAVLAEIEGGIPDHIAASMKEREARWDKAA